MACTGKLSAASRCLKWLNYLLGTFSCEERFVITFLSLLFRFKQDGYETLKTTTDIIQQYII